MAIKLLIGLGNPGLPYAVTRHNLGFMVVDRLARELRISFDHEDGIHICRGVLDGHSIILAKPQTYMNNSGPPVLAVCQAAGVSASELVVIHDDLDLTFGRIRIHGGGGDGGHRGVRSIIQTIVADIFWRLKIGVGRPESGIDTTAYLLSPIDSSAYPVFDRLIQHAVFAMKCLVIEGPISAMNRYNRRADSMDSSG